MVVDGVTRRPTDDQLEKQVVDGPCPAMARRDPLQNFLRLWSIEIKISLGSHPFIRLAVEASVSLWDKNTLGSSPERQDSRKS